MRESFAGAHIEKVHGIVNGTTNYILTEMARTGASYEDALARRSSWVTPRPTRPRTSTARTPPPRWRSSRGSRSMPPCTLDDVPYEGIEEIKADDIDYAKEFGLVLKLLGVAERRDGGIERARVPVLPVRRASAGVGRRPVQRGHARVAGDHRGDPFGPGAGGPQTASAVLGDVVSVMTSPGMELEPAQRLRFVPEEEVESAFYLHLEVADAPGVLAESRTSWATTA